LNKEVNLDITTVACIQDIARRDLFRIVNVLAFESVRHFTIFFNISCNYLPETGDWNTSLPRIANSVKYFDWGRGHDFPRSIQESTKWFVVTIIKPL